nr:MAG TPA: hypothetical protein [Caudoviricetes sp.]
MSLTHCRSSIASRRLCISSNLSSIFFEKSLFICDIAILTNATSEPAVATKVPNHFNISHQFITL